MRRSNVIHAYGERLWRSSRPEWLVVLIAALARIWRLDYHSVWFDEAVSLDWSGADPDYTWRVTFELIQEKHPAVYYVALHYWREFMELFGLRQNDSALRFFGGLLGVLTVWGILLLARHLCGRATSLLAGLLVALCPILVWYSQELRMFQPAATGIVWASYCLLRAWESENLRQRLLWWLGFIVMLEAALYTYLFSAFVLPAAGLTILFLALNERKWQRFGEGAVALGITGLLFLPLALNAWSVSGAEGTPGQAFANFGPNLWRLLKLFTLWRVPWPQWVDTGGLTLLGLLFLIGLIIPQTRPSPLASRPLPPTPLFLLLWIGIPLLIANILLSRSQSIFTQDRYLIFMAPFVLLALARGITGIGHYWQPGGLMAGIATVGILALALPHLWTPAMYRENWRAAGDYITNYQAQNSALSSAVITHVDYTHEPLEWYVRQKYAHEELPIFFPYGGQLTPDDVESVIAPPLQGLVETGVATLWLTQSHLEGVDEERLVEAWLNQRFPLVTEVYPTGIKLSGYAVQHHYAQLPALSPNANQPNAEIVAGLMLAACEILTPELSATDEELHPPSGWVHVRLWWQATGPIGDDYVAMAQMIGVEGVWGDRLYRANETLRRWPTSTWQFGEIVRDELDINLNPVTPAGEYPILIGAMDSAGQPAGERVECGRVQIGK